jgi:Mg2+-importing ATPase
MPVKIILHESYWNISKEETLQTLQTNTSSGLTEGQVSLRQKQFGLNLLHVKKFTLISLVFRQLTGNPLLIILASATFISFLLGERVSAFYVFVMILISISLGSWNEYAAEKTVENLLKKITPSALIIRNKEKQEIPVSHLTIGDIVLLSQGSIIPADLRLLEANDLEINESVLTGEANTVYKNSELLLLHKPIISEMTNIGFMGTTVESGSGKGVVVAIGKQTEFGKIAKASTFIKPATEFQKGLEKFGQLIIKIILVLTVGIFAINAFLGHNLLESMIFALAIAVGLTPELLPVIVTISLSHGAGKLAKKHVIAKRLISLENLGNMDVLCTDKTGTLTEGKIDVVDYIDVNGKKDISVLEAALICNTAIINHKVMGNAIDVALWEYALGQKILPDKTIKKIDEETFDYNRKAMYTVISKNHGEEISVLAKGAPEEILGLCPKMPQKEKIHAELLSLRKQGYRVIAIAKGAVEKKESYVWEDIKDLQFIGYITFLDIPKKTAKESLDLLHKLNVETKVITGDNEIVTQKICQEVGMDVDTIVTGPQMEKMSNEELASIVKKADIFARVSPTQKLRVILALQANGHTVGYLGDGINDLPALHNADVGISVNTAVDVAKDAASIVLLRKSLNVIADGIIEGRKTFNNTMKYILMSTSSNFGNMFSAAGASFFLKFLPMTPLQILITNGLYDISQTTIPSDNVDPESLVKPRHWNIDFIKQYMLFFGPLSSIYDFLTFGIMLFVFHARGALFQTGWFIESLATEILVVFVIRTAKVPFLLSKPSKWLAITSLGVVGIGMTLPFTPLAQELGFVVPPPLYFGILILLVTTYLVLVETVKRIFLKKYSL